MDTRRNLLIALVTILFAPRDVFAQAKRPPVMIAWLTGGSESQSSIAAFKEEMAALGWKEGASYVLEARSADGRRERLPALAAELAARKPAVIVTALATAAAAKGRAECPGGSGAGRISGGQRPRGEPRATRRHGDRDHQPPS